MMKEKKSKIIRRIERLLVKLDQAGLIRLPDKVFLRIVFELKMNERLDLEHPKSFNQKLQWLKLYDRNPKYTMLVDKYKVKKIVARIIGEEYIIPTIGIYKSFSEINFGKLPDKFVMKCTHDSGGVIICNDKTVFDTEIAEKKIKRCLRTDYYRLGREWPYKNVDRRIIIEEYLDDLSGDVIDYKFMCFNGKVHYIFTCSERFSKGGLKVTWFDTNWNKLNFERHYPASKKIIERPKDLNKMIRLAEELSGNIPFVRIDFYNMDGKIYFGEYTFFPGNGMEEFSPEIWDRKLGDLIKLPERQNEK